MDKYEIEVYILDLENVNAYIPIIRKFTKESISLIKGKIQCKEPIIVCQYTINPEELKDLYTLLETLTNKGAKIKIVQNIKNKVVRDIDIDIVSNLIQRREEINKEVEKIMDLEANE